MSILERLFWGCSRGVAVVAKRINLIINKLNWINEQVFFMFYITLQRSFLFVVVFNGLY